MAKSTWRFLFVDVNESITITEQDTKWITYMSVRAPKGNLAADFIAPDNAAMIKAMYGYPSSNWTDIYELIELNKNYGVYVSANPGTSADVPNYYGGYYQTSLGFLKMYCNTSKEDPNFEVSVRVNEMSKLLGKATAEKLTVAKLNKPGEQALITITGVPAKLIKSTSEIAFDFWGSKKPYRYALDKKNGLIKPSPNSTKDAEAQAIPCGTFEMDEEGNYTFNLGGTNALKPSEVAWNTESDQKNYGIPFIDFSTISQGVHNYANYFDAKSEKGFEDWTKASTDADEMLAALLTGGKATIENDTIDVKYDEPLYKKIRFVFNCEDYVKSWVVQKSPTAAPTEFIVSDIVYDKWNYDGVMKFVVGSNPVDVFTETETVMEEVTDEETGTTTLQPKTDETGKVITVSKPITAATLKDIAEDDYTVMVIDPAKASNNKIWKWHDADEDEEIEAGWDDVTGEYSTKKLIVVDCVNPGKDPDEAKEIAHNIYYIESKDAVILMSEDSADDKTRLTVNPEWNKYTFEAVEVDEEGEVHTSGVFRGSLDPKALNENGSECYWEEVFPADSATYAEVHVYDTFEEDLDEKGYYKGIRSELDTEATGQRYIDKVVAENIANGNTGSNISDASTAVQKQFARIAKASMVEAVAPKYDDARIFVECTGIESVKDTFTAIRKSHMMSLIVSPKLIDENTFANISTMTVEGRCRGSIQYCQELKFKDKNTREYYYSTPVGAMTAMLMRIKERALGALQADWINDKNMGGQIAEFFIGRTPKKARWDFSDPDTKIMDEKGICPIVMDVDDGVMAISSVTTELNGGDWTDIGHCSAFDECKREIRDKVMKPQIEKKINDFWMEQRESDTKDILSKWADGSADAHWASAEVEIKKINTEYTKAQKIFNIKVKVRVHPFSKYVKLTFVNQSQLTSVSEE